LIISRLPSAPVQKVPFQFQPFPRGASEARAGAERRSLVALGGGNKHPGSSGFDEFEQSPIFVGRPMALASLGHRHFFAFSPGLTSGRPTLPTHLYFALGRSGVKIIGDGRIY
jgi:hypothetical protein